MLDLGRFARVERAQGGTDTTVWHLERGQRQYALRVFRSHEISVLRREQVALEAARRGRVPVPRIFAVGTYEQRPALLTEWCTGRPLLNELRERPGQMLALGVRFGRLHAAIHRIPAPKALRADWIAWAGPLQPGLVRQLQRVSNVRQPRVLHLDYHPLNVLVQHGQMSAVLDWTNAHAGDPRVDFARTVSILRLSPPVAGTGQCAVRLLLEIGWRLGYGAPGGDMAPFYAWAGAAMQHDLGPRHPPSELAHIERWTDAWLRRISL